MTNSEFLFYAVFAAQIALLSVYLPKRISTRMRRVLKEVPPAEYPKMYPLPEDRYVLGEMAFRFINHGIAVFGIGLFFSMMFWVDHATFADSGAISEFWPAGYAVLQFLPVLGLEISGFSQYRKMRTVATERRGDLQPRKLAQLLPGWLLVIALASFFLAVYLDYYANHFVMEWDKVTAFAAGNAFMAAVAVWIIFGTKQDPHQTKADRARVGSAALHSMVYVSIAMSIFYMSTALDQIFDLASFKATLMSLYFIAIGWFSVGTMLRNVRLEDLNFDVYKVQR